MSFETVFLGFAKRHQKLFDYLYPAAGRDKGFTEASLTSDFLAALSDEVTLKDCAFWSEFPVPDRFNIARDNSRSKNDTNHIDALAINQESIFLIESKYLMTSISGKQIRSLAHDALREACFLLESDELSSRIWSDPNHSKPISKVEYGRRKKYGVLLGNFWIKLPNYNGRGGTQDYHGDPELFFAKKLMSALRGSESLWNKSPIVNVPFPFKYGVDMERVFVSEIHCNDSRLAGYKYFVAAYYFEIDSNLGKIRDAVKPLGTVGPLSSNNASSSARPNSANLDAIKDKMKQLPIVIEERAKFWYLYPSRFIGSYVKGADIKNKLWVYKSGHPCKLYAYSQDSSHARSINLPAWFIQDADNNEWVSMDISSDSVVEDLKRVFEEIIRLNP